MCGGGREGSSGIEGGFWWVWYEDVPARNGRATCKSILMAAVRRGDGGIQGGERERDGDH